jgi:cell division protein FtsB
MIRWGMFAVLGITLFNLQYQLWWGKDGRKDQQRLQQLITAQHLENTQLQRRNAGLAAEIFDLKTNHEALEERARADFGMVKPGETFYQFVK